VCFKYRFPMTVAKTGQSTLKKSGVLNFEYKQIRYMNVYELTSFKLTDIRRRRVKFAVSVPHDN